MQAGLMGVAFESYVIDNDILGAVLRSLGPVPVDDDTLSPALIGAVAGGEVHFLGQPQTLARMQSDFLYPQIADRRSAAEWEAGGAHDIPRASTGKGAGDPRRPPPGAYSGRSRCRPAAAVRHPAAATLTRRRAGGGRDGD